MVGEGPISQSGLLVLKGKEGTKEGASVSSR